MACAREAGRQAKWWHVPVRLGGGQSSGRHIACYSRVETYQAEKMVT